MEKIKAALEKVKSNKSERKSNSVPKVVDKNLVSNINQDIVNIKYTNTKVVKLNTSHLERSRIVSHLGHNSDASVFDSLRTKVLQRMEENNWQSIAIVSPTAESGKTVVSINLAISIARQPNKTTILVDFDLRKPKVASYLGLEVTKSLNDYFDNKASVEDALVNPSIQRFVIMPTLKPILGAAEVLSSGKATQLISELKERYDSRIVVYDLPPILNVDDAAIVIPQVDCVLMVIANGQSTAEEIEDALNMLPKERLVGIVYNKADSENKNYYY